MTSILRAQFHNFRTIQGLRGLEIQQKYGRHTLGILDYTFRSKADYLLPDPDEGKPVQVRWGTSPLKVSTFYGYLNHYETDRAPRGVAASTQVYLLGTSKVMNSANPTTWTGMTRSGVAREIFKRHGLRSVVHVHPQVLDAWSTGTRTDFQSLQALADESGYRFWVDGATGYFLDPAHTLRSAATMTVPVVRKSQIREAKVTGGRNAPRDEGLIRHRVVYGLDQSTNELFTVTGGNSNMPDQVMGVPATNFGEANYITQAFSQRDDHLYELRMTCDGDPALYPGALFRVGGGQVNTDQAGYWVVAEATHRVDKNDFTTQLIAYRGSNSVHKSRSTIIGVKHQVKSVIRLGNRWEAQIQEHVNV